MRVDMRERAADVRQGWAMTGRILKTLAREAWGRDSRVAVAAREVAGFLRRQGWVCAP
jgi:hypothetical protein